MRVPMALLSALFCSSVISVSWGGSDPKTTGSSGHNLNHSLFNVIQNASVFLIRWCSQKVSRRAISHSVCSGVVHRWGAILICSTKHVMWGCVVWRRVVWRRVVRRRVVWKRARKAYSVKTHQEKYFGWSFPKVSVSDPHYSYQKTYLGNILRVHAYSAIWYN